MERLLRTGLADAVRRPFASKLHLVRRASRSAFDKLEAVVSVVVAITSLVEGWVQYVRGKYRSMGAKLEVG